MSHRTFNNIAAVTTNGDNNGIFEKRSALENEAVSALRCELRAACIEEQEALLQRFDDIIDAWMQSQDMAALTPCQAVDQGRAAKPKKGVAMPKNDRLERVTSASVAIDDITLEEESALVTDTSSRKSCVDKELVSNIHAGRMMMFSHMEETLEDMKKGMDPLGFYKHAMGPFAFCVDWWAGLQEPARKGSIADMVQGHTFELVCLAVIICNTLYTIVDTNYSMENMTKDKTILMSAIEISFTGFYVAELSLKVWVHRLYFLCNSDMRWNILDSFLVLSGILEIVTNTSSNPSFVRMVRVVRITRVLRMVRLLRFFAELRLMLTCVIGSLMSLFWAFFLILAFSVLFAIILVQHLQTYLLDAINRQEVSDEFVTLIRKSFGSVQLATFTLFKGISGGDWTTYYDIVEKTGWSNAAIFLVYILFVWLSVTNIITCIFVEKAMKLAQPDIEELLFEKRKAEIEVAEELQSLFESIERAKDGIITWKEFERCMNDDRITSYLEVNGLSINDAFIFFRMLASSVGSSNIDVNTLVRGCIKMKGVAQNIDLLQLGYEVKIISRNQQHLLKVLEKEMMAIGSIITDNQHKLSGTLHSKVANLLEHFGKDFENQSAGESRIATENSDDILVLPGDHSYV